MIANLFLPLTQYMSDTSFNTDVKITNEEYGDMVMKHYNETTDQINNFLNGNSKVRKTINMVNDVKNTECYEEIEALLLDSNKNDLEENIFFEHISNERPFILIMNINPTIIDGDTEEEIKYWIDESFSVWNDKTLDKQTKLNISPSKTLKIKLSDNKIYKLQNCKIFENYSSSKFPLYFACFVETITE